MSTSAELSFAAGFAVGTQHRLHVEEDASMTQERRAEYVAALVRLERAVKAELKHQCKLLWATYGVTPG